LTGLTQEVVGTGTESGITYIDIKLSGTPSGAGVYRYFFEGATTAAALTGQSWSSAWYRKLVAGSLTGISTFGDLYQEFTSAGAFVTEASINTTSPTASSLASQRGSTTRTLAGGATTAFVRSGIQISLTGAAIDITLRIGLPQLELGAFATSVIPTTTTALTRAADVASVGTLTPWYNAVEGTIYAELQSLSPLTPAQSAALGKFPDVLRFLQSGATTTINWYGTGAELYIGNVYNNLGSVIVGGINKVSVGMAASGGQSASSLNGAAAVNRSGTNSTAPTVLGLGNNGSAGANTFLNGHLRRITYYPRRLADAELQAITL
jgi:hypothetical protein